MQKLIDQPTASDSAAEESADANLTHPAWCDPAECWAYENADEDPPVGGFHLSRVIAVPTFTSEVTLQVTQDHGAAGDNGQPYLEMTVGAPDDGSTRHLTLDYAAQLYHALQVLLPELVNGNTTREIFRLGEKNGRRSEQLRLAAEAQFNREQVSADTLGALERLKERFNNAERETYRAYCNGYVDALDGVAPAFGVTR